MHGESCGGGPAGGDQLATGNGPEPRRSDSGERPAKGISAGNTSSPVRQPPTGRPDQRRSATRISDESLDHGGVAGVANLRADIDSDIACDNPFRSDLASTRIMLLICGGQNATALLLL